MNRQLRRPPLIALACSATLACLGGCADLYRSDADRQVQQIIRDEQKRTIDYTPAVSVPVTEPAKPTRKSYAKVPATEMPELLKDVVSVARITDRSRTLGPRIDVAAIAPQATVTTGSAVARVRTMTRGRYELGPAASIGNAQRFGLFESIAYAVEHSRNYQSQMEQLYVTALDVTLERHLFEPRPFANVRAEYSGGQESVNYRSAMNIIGEAGVRQRLPLGGEIVASGLVRFVNALNEQTADGEDAELALTGSIPLLRGAGFVNLEPLIQSERDVIYAVRSFENFRRNFVIQVASSYFRLLTRQQSIRNRYVRYLNAIELTNRTEALFDSGRITALEVQRAQQDLLQGEDEVNDALETYENSLDQFKLLLGMPVAQELEIVPIQVEVPLPKLDVDVATGLARQFRLDLQTARDQVEDARRRVANAENNLLPDLSVTAGADVGNPNDTRARQVNVDTLTYNAGLRLDLPLDRVAERNRYRVSLINLEAARRQVLELEDEVVADVRVSLRGIRSAITSLELQRQGIEIARQRLESANEFLLLGRTSDSRNVVEAQTSLLRAQDAFDSARADLQIAILTYLRDAGVLRLDPNSGELGLAMTHDEIGASATTKPVQGTQTTSE